MQEVEAGIVAESGGWAWGCKFSAFPDIASLSKQTPSRSFISFTGVEYVAPISLSRILGKSLCHKEGLDWPPMQ